MRSQLVGLIASSIEPIMFAELSIGKGIRSLAYLLDKPIAYRNSPDLFCLDLYKEFDLDLLALAAEPVKISYPTNEELP